MNGEELGVHIGNVHQVHITYAGYVIRVAHGMLRAKRRGQYQSGSCTERQKLVKFPSLHANATPPYKS